MRKARKFKTLLVFLSCLFLMAVSLVCSGVAFAAENPADTTINYTLEGDPNCINYGWIETGGDDVIGIKPGDGGTASNFGTVITYGQRAYGIYAYGFGSTAMNESGGSITTVGTGAHGMYALNGATTENLGTIITYYIQAYGMYADGSGSTATNESGGTITTYGQNAYGMYAGNGSTATNAGTITTYGTSAHGMFADGSGSTATNSGTITIGKEGDPSPSYGYQAYGMYALNGAKATNSGTITTYGQYAHGMFASGSTATNSGTITTYGYYAYGMLADGSGSTATNESGGIIETYGDDAYGMYAENGSTATNKGTITTSGTGAAYGMYAFNGAKATNESGGSITTYGRQAHGMYAYGSGSTATNKGTITTTDWYAYGMYADNGSTATNSGTITTENSYAEGMYAGNGSTVTNESGGSITTYGEWASGMDAVYSSTATNEIGGIIKTLDEYAHGMRATSESTITNKGTITTEGSEASGMYVDFQSTGTNAGIITTKDNYAYGMYAYNGSAATNESGGSITTSGSNAYGMFAYGSTATNSGTITTEGKEAYGMYANNSTTTNESGGTITTYNEGAHGMYAYASGSDSTATNSGTITTEGKEAYGMQAEGGSTATNNGTITTYGDDAYGMLASGSTAKNWGTITTEGKEAYGMYLNYTSRGTNSGSITVTGEGADAAYVGSSTFTNSGTLDSLNGNAVTAINSTVILEDGTKLLNSHVIQGDDTSTLNVEMDEGLSAIVKDFKAFNKNGTGTLTLEGGSSAGTTNNNAGTLKIAPDTTFHTDSYTQTEDASLHLYVPTNPNIDPPLYVNGDATFAGNVTIDYSSNPLPGRYKYIYVTGEKFGDFSSVSFVNPGGIYIEEKPQWVEGDSWSYIGNVGKSVPLDVEYAFSEQALGLVAAIEDWSLLRWVMANHLQDVASEKDKFEVGKKAFYAHFLGSHAERDPAGKSPLGYDADTKGLSLGFDKKVNDTTVWGVYAGYTEKDIDFTDVAPAASDWEEQDTWHLGAYLSKRFNDRWVVSDTLTYRTTDHDSFRRQADGDAKGSFDSWAITNDIRVGYIAQEGKGSRWEITPEFGLNIGYFERDGYTETNGYTYGDYDTTVTEGVIGVRMQGEYLSEDGLRCAPRLRLSYVKVLSGDDVTIDQSWHGRTRWYTEDLDDDYFVVDAGVTLYNAKNFDISLNYNGRFGDNTDSQGGWLRLEWKF